MIQKLPLRNGERPVALRDGDDLVRAVTRGHRVRAYGNARNFNLVTDPGDRLGRSIIKDDARKFRQWNRVSRRLDFAGMIAEDRRVLQSFGEHLMAVKVARVNVGKVHATA